MPKTSDGTNWNVVLGTGVVLMLFTAFSLPSLIVFVVGLLPTGVAWIIDRSEQRTGTFCVGGMNMCGVFPYVLKLWTDNHSVHAAMETISEVLTLVIMYAAAGFGWMIFITIPPVIASFLSVMAQTRVKQLRTLQREIMEEWGPEVASTVDDTLEADE
ncbi:MAG: hypothetical protein VW405_12360 [Rhodospirillaceae bacterium]